MRIQFYPSSELSAKLKSDADKDGVSINSVVLDLLNTHYRLISIKNSKEISSISILEKKVLDEILCYVQEHLNSEDKEFDINKASPSYREISNNYTHSANALKARIGKIFNKKVGKLPFVNVRQCMLPNGNPKRTPKNRAAIYEIV